MVLETAQKQTENSVALEEHTRIQCPMSYDFRLKFAGDKGQIQADPAHHAAVRRLTGNGRTSSDPLRITPTGEPRIGGGAPESVAGFADAVLDTAPLPPIWRMDPRQRASSR